MKFWSISKNSWYQEQEDSCSLFYWAAFRKFQSSFVPVVCSVLSICSVSLCTAWSTRTKLPTQTCKQTNQQHHVEPSRRLHVDTLTLCPASRYSENQSNQTAAEVVVLQWWTETGSNDVPHVSEHTHTDTHNCCIWFLLSARWDQFSCRPARWCSFTSWHEELRTAKSDSSTRNVLMKKILQ